MWIWLRTPASFRAELDAFDDFGIDPLVAAGEEAHHGALDVAGLAHAGAAARRRTARRR